VRYKNDGGVISSSVPMSPIMEREHNKMFGLYRGQVIRVIYPDEPESINKKRIEYVVKVNGQEYPNAISMKQLGGIFQQQETVHKGVEKSITGEINTAQYPENIDGEMVYVMFIEGHGNVPLILGCAEHPRSEKKLKKEDGLIDYKQFNGVEFSIDKESNYIIKQAGRKDPEGKVLNEAGKDSFVKMSGNGDVEINTHGTEGSADLRMKFTKEAKKMEFYAQENKVIYDDQGVSIVDKNNNEFKFTSGGVQMKAVDKLSMQSTGDAEMKSDAKVIIEGTGGTDVGSSASPTNINGTTVALAGGGLPVAKLGSKAIGTGNYGAPVVSTIVDGSTKVTTA
jgi:hypothetical protein